MEAIEWQLVKTLMKSDVHLTKRRGASSVCSTCPVTMWRPAADHSNESLGRVENQSHKIPRACDLLHSGYALSGSACGDDWTLEVDRRTVDVDGTSSHSFASNLQGERTFITAMPENLQGLQHLTLRLLRKQERNLEPHSQGEAPGGCTAFPYRLIG